MTMNPLSTSEKKDQPWSDEMIKAAIQRPPPPNRQLEIMTKLTVFNFTVRIWSTTDDLANEHPIQHDLYLKSLEFMHEGGLMLPKTKAQVAEYFAGLPNVAAVEVLSPYTGEGVLIYPDWK